MQRQTFIGNTKATKGDITVRLVPLSNHGACISTPAVAAMTAKDATDTETPRIIDAPTVQP